MNTKALEETTLHYAGFSGEPKVNRSTLSWSIVATDPNGHTITAEGLTYGLLNQNLRAAVDGYHKQLRKERSAKHGE